VAVKNQLSAKDSCPCRGKINRVIIIMEMRGLDRTIVDLAKNASDFALFYSDSKDSPQFTKETLASNCPIVTTIVGDINWIIGTSKGSFISSSFIEDVAEKLTRSIKYSEISD
jgi:hypothetical protein